MDKAVEHHKQSSMIHPNSGFKDVSTESLVDFGSLGPEV